MMTSTYRRFTPLMLLAFLSAVPIALAAEGKAQTFKLELKKLSESRSRVIDFGKPPGDEAMRAWCNSQSVWSMEGARQGGDDKTSFTALVKKEPKYTSDFVIRGVVKFGKDAFPFACDATDMKKKGFDKLYFDVNCNGDLTDDPVVSAKKADFEGASFSDYVPERAFPRVDLKIHVGDTEQDYAFFMTARAYAMTQYVEGANAEPKKTWQGYAEFMPAVYREGEITLDGKKHKIALLDYNANGTFDNATELYGDENFRKQRKAAYAISGDMLLVDPDSKVLSVGYGFNVSDRPERRHVSKLVWIEDRYWELKVAPSGETITLTPSERPTGTVSHPALRYHAVVYGEQGFLAIHGSKDTPVVLPEGEWKLLDYTIDLTEPKKPPATAPAKAEKPSNTLLGNLFQSITGSIGSDRDRPDITIVSANAPWDYKPVKIAKGQATPMPFGPPYKPAVSVGYFRDKDTANLQMQLLGSAGEECSNLMVKGDRPPAPTFSIATVKDEIVERGKFEFG